MFDDMNGKLTEQLRKLAKQVSLTLTHSLTHSHTHTGLKGLCVSKVQDTMLARDDQGLKKWVQEYDQLLEK